MRLIKVMFLLVFSMNISAAPDQIFPRSKCSISNAIEPDCYHDRNNSFLNVALIYYGDFWNESDLERLEPILKDRFFKATSEKIHLNVILKKVIPFKHRAPSDYQNNGITDKDRLQRLWYYDNINGKVLVEVHEQVKKYVDKKLVDKLDVILTVTGAQFEGLGFAYGRVSVTEQPQEIAWGLENKGRTNIMSDYSLADELIHELGHNMFLGHVSTQCQKRGLTPKQRKACCANSPGKKDVLSYCRDRNLVSKDKMYGFEACNQSMLDDLVIPALTSGGEWHVRGRKRCL